MQRFTPIKVVRHRNKLATVLGPNKADFGGLRPNARLMTVLSWHLDFWTMELYGLWTMDFLDILYLYFSLPVCLLHIV